MPPTCLQLFKFWTSPVFLAYSLVTVSMRNYASSQLTAEIPSRAEIVAKRTRHASFLYTTFYLGNNSRHLSSSRDTTFCSGARRKRIILDARRAMFMSSRTPLLFLQIRHEGSKRGLSSPLIYFRALFFGPPSNSN